MFGNVMLKTPEIVVLNEFYLTTVPSRTGAHALPYQGDSNYLLQFSHTRLHLPEKALICERIPRVFTHEVILKIKPESNIFRIRNRRFTSSIKASETNSSTSESIAINHICSVQLPSSNDHSIQNLEPPLRAHELHPEFRLLIANRPR